MNAIDALLQGKKGVVATKKTGKVSAIDQLLQKKPVKPTIQPVKTTLPTQQNYIKATLPKDLGGGSYYLQKGEPNKLITPEATKTYGSLKPKTGQERDHFIAQSLGGASDDYNLNYVPAEVNQAWAKIERKNLNAYKRGEISLPQARLNVLKEKQEWLMKQKGISQSVKDNLIYIAKDPVNPVNTARAVLKMVKSPVSLVKEYAKAIMPKTTAELETQIEVQKKSNQPMRFDVGAGMSNVEKVLPGPRLSTLEATEQGAQIEPVQAGEAPQISPVRQAQQVVRKPDLSPQKPSAIDKLLSGVSAVGGAIRATSDIASLPGSLAINALSGEQRLPARDIIEATSKMIEEDMKTGGQSSIQKAGQIYLAYRGIGKYGGEDYNVGDVAVLALIGLVDYFDPVLYFGAVKPALEELKYLSKGYKKVGTAGFKFPKGVKLQDPQKVVLSSFGDELKLVIDPKTKTLTMRGYAKKGVAKQVIDQKLLDNFAQSAAKESGIPMVAKVSGNDIVISASKSALVAPKTIPTATKVVSAGKVVIPKAEIKPQKAQGEVLPTKTTKTPAEANKYLYHGTNEAVLDNISKEGLKPGMRGQLSLSKTDKYAMTFAREGMTPSGKTNSVMLRVKSDFLDGKTTLKRVDGKERPMPDQLNELLTKETIPPEYLEIYKDGKWQPLTTKVSPEAKPSVVEPLIEEAKKYKSADEFVKAQKDKFIKEQGFEPSDKALADWFEAKQVQPYLGIGGQNPEFFAGKPSLSELPKNEISKYLEFTKDGKAIYYRGIPKDVKTRGIRYGDFLSPNKGKASFYGKVEKYEIDPKYVYQLGDLEAVYFNPKDKLKAPKPQSITEIWNKAHKEVKPEVKLEEKPIPKELEPLAEEARKYGSAEEFVRGIKNKVDISFTKGKPSSSILENVFKALSPKEQKELFTRMPSRRVYDRWFRKTAVEDMALNPEARLVMKELPTPYLLEKGKEVPVINISGNNIPLSEAEFKYYQAIKSQLTDFYNQAVKGTKEVKEVKKPTLPKRQPPKNIPPKKPAVVKSKTANQELIGKSKLAQGVEAKAIAKKLTEGFADLPEYEKINIKDQATKARKLLEDDYPRAERIALGKELPPEGILPESVFIAVENRAIKNKDVNTLRRLATESGLSNEATLMGQRIRTLAERVEDSPTAVMAKVIKNRKEYYALKHKTPLDEAIKRETKKIKSYVKPVKEDEWIKFINELTC